MLTSASQGVVPSSRVSNRLAWACCRLPFETFAAAAPASGPSLFPSFLTPWSLLGFRLTWYDFVQNGWTPLTLVVTILSVLEQAPVARGVTTGCQDEDYDQGRRVEKHRR